jgi:hypothetical protein
MKTSVVLTLAVAACIVALSAASASAAVEFRSSISPETIVGIGGVQTFELGGNTVKCAELSHEDSSQVFPTEQLKEKVHYELCEGGKMAQTGKVLCLEYNFHSNGSITTTECKFEFPSCKIIVPEQGPLSGISYTNVGSSIVVKAAIKGITYKAGEGCPNAGSGKNGEYKGEIKDKGKNGAALEVK